MGERLIPEEDAKRLIIADLTKYPDKILTFQGIVVNLENRGFRISNNLVIKVVNDLIESKDLKLVMYNVSNQDIRDARDCRELGVQILRTS